MSKNALIKIILICSLAFYKNCEIAKADTDSNKIVIDSLSRKQIKLLINGETDTYFSLISKSYTDLGGGPKRDGKVDFGKWKEFLTGLALSAEFQKLRGKNAGDLLDTNKVEILNYSEILKGKGNISKFSYLLKEGDYWIYYPTKSGSFFSDGWFAIFRKENNEWKIVAGD